VLAASSARVALMRELRGAGEPSLAELLRMLAPVDLVLIEGFKREAFPKIEVYRASLGKPRLQLLDPDIVALVGDPLPSALLPHAHVDDIAAVAALVLAHAAPAESLPERLARDHG